MAQRMTRKQLLKQDDIAEVAFDFGHWLEEHWPKVLKWVGGVALVALAVVAVVLMVQSRKTARETLLADAQRQFEKAQAADFANPADLEGALTGFDQVIDKAGNSEVGQVAHYFKAATLRKLGRSDEAVSTAEALVGQSSLPPTLQTSAELLLVDLYTESGRAQDAIARLSAGLESTTPALPKEQALVKIGEIHKVQGDLDAAHEAWRQVIDEFPGSPAANQARQLLGPHA